MKIKISNKVLITIISIVLTSSVYASGAHQEDSSLEETRRVQEAVAHQEGLKQLPADIRKELDKQVEDIDIQVKPFDGTFLTEAELKEKTVHPYFAEINRLEKEAIAKAEQRQTRQAPEVKIPQGKASQQVQASQQVKIPQGKAAQQLRRPQRTKNGQPGKLNYRGYSQNNNGSYLNGQYFGENPSKNRRRNSYSSRERRGLLGGKRLFRGGFVRRFLSRFRRDRGKSSRGGLFSRLRGRNSSRGGFFSRLRNRGSSRSQRSRRPRFKLFSRLRSRWFSNSSRNNCSKCRRGQDHDYYRRKAFRSKSS